MTLFLVVTGIVALCFAGFAIGLIVRRKPPNTCGCGRGHCHRDRPDA